MKKDLVRDYATEAFRAYARMGCPVDLVHTGDAALDADITAVQRTVRHFQADGREGIADAVRAVYFAAPGAELRRGDISARVERFAAEYYASVPSVYRWLGRARRRFALERGLRIK
jgi:hypothetical protein